MSQTLIELGANVKACRRCTLRNQCKRRIPGVGLQRARVMFVGLAPSKQEDSHGLPFVGPAGVLQSELIRSVPDLDVKDIYFTYLVKCFPGKKGRTDKLPPAESVEACQDWFLQELELVNPELIVAIGAPVMRHFGIKGGIQQNSGRVFDTEWGPVMPLLSPGQLFTDKKLVPKFRVHLNRIVTFLRGEAELPPSGKVLDSDTSEPYGLDIETEDDQIWCIAYANTESREAIRVD